MQLKNNLEKKNKTKIKYKMIKKKKKKINKLIIIIKKRKKEFEKRILKKKRILKNLKIFKTISTKNKLAIIIKIKAIKIPHKIVLIKRKKK